MKKCACGCGQYVTKQQNKYIHGHNHKGKTYNDIYGDRSHVQKESRRKAVLGTSRPDILGDNNPAKRKDIRKKISRGVKNSWRLNPESRCSEESIKKIRATKEKNGTCIKEKDLPLFELYKRRVKKYTNKSIKEKYTQEELKNIGRKKHDDTVDHIYSVHQGFIDGILPQIIGCKFNIRLISRSKNSIKHTDCDMSKRRLFENYDREVF